MRITNWHQFLICAATISCCSLVHIAPILAVPEIAATATSNAVNLPIASTEATVEIRQVADLQISTTATGGLKLIVNQTSLANLSNNQIPVQFITVFDGDAPPNSSAFTTAATTNYEFVTNAAGSANLDLYIKYTPGQLQDPGNYNATIQISVADNP